MKTTLLFNLLFMLTLSLCHFVHAMNCPSTVYVELGKDGIINCQISNNGDVYWYRGNSTKTSPIARLENGQKTLSQESNRYDIGEEGSLIIKNMEEQSYGFYSVVNFYANDKHDSDLVKVEIAVKPQTMCPVIAGCNDCDHCVLTKSETGNISCGIGGTRPHVHLNIVTDSENWINVIRNISEETYDPVTDTWSSTVTVQYSEWYDCGTTLHLRCVTEKRHLFELSDSIAHINLDSCKSTTQTSAYQTPLAEDTGRVYVFAIPIAIVVIFVVIVLVIVLYRKSGTCRKHKTDKVDTESGEEEELLPNTNTPDNVKHVIDTLKKAYEDFQMFTSTPNGDRIPTDEVFQDVTFTITKAGNDNNTISSSQMVETLFGKERSFVFIDDGEYGRKAFKHYICSGLCAQNMDQNIIWYVNLNDLDINMTIADAMDKQMNLHGKVSADIIQTILSTHKCLFVFDEVHDELNQSNGDESTQNSEKEPPGELTINDVLTGSHRFEGFRKARCLFISKNNINETSYSFTKRHIYITIATFADEYLNLYVSRIFKCYQTLKATNTNKSSEKTDGTNDGEDISSPIAHTDGEVVTTCVSDLILDKENIIGQTDMCPSSLILLIHLLISDITKKVINNIAFYIIRRSYLTRLILECLQFQFFSSLQKYKDVDNLMLTLGKASFEKSLEDTSFTEKCKFISKYEIREFESKTTKEDFDTAFTMGLLKPVRNRDCNKAVDASCPSPDSLVEFRHKYIQEYAVAQAIASNKTVQERFLKSKRLKEDERMKRVLQFMHRTEAKKRQELLKKLVVEQSWNNLIDCLFQCENDDDFIKIKSALSSFIGDKYAVNIIDTDKLYHGMAVSRFCKTLADNNVSLEALTFRKHCELQYFSRLEIPEVKFLVFFEIDLQQGNDFIAFIKQACQMNVTKKIQFVKCKCPEKIQEIADIINKSSNVPEIQRTDDVVAYANKNWNIFSNVQWYKLNLEKGCWEKA